MARVLDWGEIHPLEAEALLILTDALLVGTEEQKETDKPSKESQEITDPWPTRKVAAC